MTDFCKFGKFERLLVNLGSSCIGGILTFVFVIKVQSVQKIQGAPRPVVSRSEV
jgi:hypothetical protein